MIGQQLADEIVAAFVRKCERLWPGCVVTVRTNQDRNAPSQFWTQSKTAPAGSRKHEEGK